MGTAVAGGGMVRHKRRERRPTLPLPVPRQFAPNYASERGGKRHMDGGGNGRPTRVDSLLDEWRQSVNDSINELREGQNVSAVALSKVQENMLALDARMKRVETSPAAWRGNLTVGLMAIGIMLTTLCSGLGVLVSVLEPLILHH